MKARLYKKHVLDGERAMSSFTSNYIKGHRKHIAFFILSLLLTCFISVLFSLTLARYTHIGLAFTITSVALVPGIVRLLIPQALLLMAEHQNIRQLKLDRNNYADWMSMQARKISASDNDNACRVVSQYRNTYLERHGELLRLLNDSLKQKPANQLIVSVIAGLVFLTNDTSDYKTLFNAKYRHGAAGNMIPDVWIKILDPKQKMAELHSDYAKEFLSYWDQKSNLVK